MIIPRISGCVSAQFVHAYFCFFKIKLLCCVDVKLQAWNLDDDDDDDGDDADDDDDDDDYADDAVDEDYDGFKGDEDDDNPDDGHDDHNANNDEAADVVKDWWQWK